MVYPPATQPTNSTNDTASLNTHPTLHNDANGAINDIVAELGRRIDAVSKTRRQAWMASLPGGTTLSGIQAPATTVTGTASNADDDRGPIVNYATSSTNGTDAGHKTTAFNWMRPAWTPEVVFVIQPVDLTSVRIWAALCSGSLGVADPPGHFAGFRFDSSVDTNGNWRAASNDNSGSGLFTDSGIAVTAARTVLGVSLTGTAARFTINGTQVAEHTTDLPGSSQGLGFELRCYNLIAAVRNLKIGHIGSVFSN